MSQLTPEQKKQLEWVIQNQRLEGYEPSEEAIKEAEQVLLGQKTAEQAIKDIIKRNTNL